MTRVEPLEPGPDGHPRWRLRVPALEASILAGLPDRLEDLLTHPERNARIIARLFPRAHDDETDNLEYRRLLGDSLFDSRREMVGQVRSMLGAARAVGDSLHLELGPREIDVWLRFVNDARLMLATDLGVDGAPDDHPVDWGHPDAPRHALLEYLGAVEMLLLGAVSPGVLDCGRSDAAEDGEDEHDDDGDDGDGDGGDGDGGDDGDDGDDGDGNGNADEQEDESS